jgi:hypothetical protein
MRRDLGVGPAEALRIIKGAGSLGFSAWIEVHESGDDQEDVLYAHWQDRTMYRNRKITDFARTRSTEVAVRMWEILMERMCTGHFGEHLERLDFSDLAGHR